MGVLGDGDILALALCAVISFLAYSMRIWTLALVSTVGLSILAMRFYADSGDLLILALMLAVAWIQMIAIQKRTG